MKGVRLAVVCLMVLASVVIGVGMPNVAYAQPPTCSGSSNTPSAGFGQIGAGATVTCTQQVSTITVRAEVSKSGGPFYANSKTCNNTTSCSASVSGAFSSGCWSSSGTGSAYNGQTWTSTWFGSTKCF